MSRRMNCFTTYKNYDADTTNGHKIVVTQTYTSFDEQDINALEKYLQQTIGSGVSMEIGIKEQTDEQNK